MSSAPASTTRAVRLVVLLQRLYEAPDRPAPGLLGHCEAAALSAAVRLRERLGGTLAALVMGPEEHLRPVLAAAIAAGCQRAVRVHAPDCEGLDYLGVATVLAAAVRRLGCDLLLCGDTGENERTGAVGPAVAELLGIAHLTGVLGVDVAGAPGRAADSAADSAATGTADSATDSAATETADDGTAKTSDGATDSALVVVHRGGGRIHRFRWSLPAALCLLAPVPAPAADARPGDSDGAPSTEPAIEPPIETLGLDELGIHARALAHRRRLLGQADTDVGRGAIVVAGADDLVSRLVADGMLR